MDTLASLWNAFAGTLLDVLPSSPFTSVIAAMEGLPYLGYLNWFFPVRSCLTVIGYWLAAYGVYLLYSIIMRWLKVIGG